METHTHSHRDTHMCDWIDENIHTLKRHTSPWRHTPSISPQWEVWQDLRWGEGEREGGGGGGGGEQESEGFQVLWQQSSKNETRCFPSIAKALSEVLAAAELEPPKEKKPQEKSIPILLKPHSSSGTVTSAYGKDSSPGLKNRNRHPHTDECWGSKTRR